ncbi:MAG: pantothenate kinase [Clostridiales bacterium]|jgi:type III pantothenate kinase|nr:pantothenate kinase [Clostridiales bacterium]
MLLVIDIGNTNITIGAFKGEELSGSWRMTTKFQRTSDEYGIFVCEALKYKGMDAKDVDAVVFASVVPNMNYSFLNGLKKYITDNILIVGPGIKTGIKLAVENPKEIGADRIVDAVAAYGIYGGPILVIDFGTATTYDLITEDGSFIAGITCPGIKLSANALGQGTAKLPVIEIKKPDSILAKETISSIQAGIVYGHIGQTEYIIKKVIEESGFGKLKVVATGGLGKVIVDETRYIHHYDSMLTLKGLRILYEKNLK